MRHNDPTFSKTQAVTDWLSFGDQLDYFNFSSGYGYAVGAYHSSVYGAVHALCSTDDRVKIEWPFRDREASFKHRQRENIIQCTIESVAGSVRAFSKTAFAVDMVASIADIISPKFRVGRGGSISSLTPSEINGLERVNTIMKEFGLTFKMARSDSEMMCYKCNQSGNQN